MSLLSTLFCVQSSSGRSWCRPTHRTNQIAVVGGNACCICIPATATCFVIEMWAQGGGGAASCCCAGGLYGGMGGDYAWVTCTTSATSHTLCACACLCCCCSLGVCAYGGSPGQTAQVVNCSITNTFKVGNGSNACGGANCCFYWAFASPGCALTQQILNGHNPWAYNCCFVPLWNNNWCNDCCCSWDWWCCSGKNPFIQGANMPFQQIQGTDIFGQTWTKCNCFNFYVRGGCGFTDSPYWMMDACVCNATACICAQTCCVIGMPSQAGCGLNWGIGGSSYAGAGPQWCNCGPTSNQYGGVTGNMPGGGGSSASGTGVSGGCCLGGPGGASLILISWQ